MKNLKPLGLLLLVLGAAGCNCNGGNNTTCSASMPCSSGECVNGTCSMCTKGDKGCTCLSNGSCNAGASCSSGVCQACTAGTMGCACNTGNQCNTGLTCMSNLCVAANCTDGASGCPCRGTTPKCDGTLMCSTANLCQACGNDMVGCPCVSGACTGGLVCDSTSTNCRAATTCADAADAGTCAPHQACTMTSGSDATCVASMCESGYEWNSVTMQCQQCVSTNCASEPTCANGSGGIGDQCDAQNRLCMLAGTVAYCAACKTGYVQDTGGVCEPIASCNGAMCQATEYCDSTGMSGCSTPPCCATLPCPTGQAKDTSNACSSCGNFTCTGAGVTGRIWPFKDASDNCVCETYPGFFVPAGGNGGATRCDADNDGWVNRKANTTDPARLANARCTVRAVDTIRLMDESGLYVDMLSCLNGVQPADAGACTGGAMPLHLYESETNDTPNYTPDNKHPPYGLLSDGGPGRMIQANELNALTKGCMATVATGKADYNENGADDVAEVGTPTSSAEDVRLAGFSYFMELYDSYYLAGSGPNGKLVIHERSRCDSTFPLHYDVTNPLAPGDLYAADAGSTYWRNCGRGRDPAFNVAKPNFDFAQWDCAGSGACPTLPPMHQTLAAPTDPANELLRNFGLCEMNGQVPFDGIWRGMTHHSQFKCVSVILAASTSGYEVQASDISDGGTLKFNLCAPRPCASPTDPACSVAQGTGANTRRPVFDCTTVPTALNRVGFAAVKYKPYGPIGDAGYTTTAYQGGCYNDDVETPYPAQAAYGTYLCPYPEYNNPITGAQAGKQKLNSDTSYGRYSCVNDLPNFLWAPPNDRSTLLWAPDALNTMSGYWR